MRIQAGVSALHHRWKCLSSLGSGTVSGWARFAFAGAPFEAACGPRSASCCQTWCHRNTQLNNHALLWPISCGILTALRTPHHSGSLHACQGSAACQCPSGFRAADQSMPVGCTMSDRLAPLQCHWQRSLLHRHCAVGVQPAGGAAGGAPASSCTSERRVGDMERVVDCWT